MEAMILSWAETQSWWHIVSTVVVIANGITMTLKDKYMEDIPMLGKIWPVLNWLSLNIGTIKMTLLRTVSNYLTKIQLWVREQHCSQWVQKWSCCSPTDIERDVMKGKIAAYHSGSGQVLSEGNAYHFHINIVQGQITNGTEVEFEVNENGKLKGIQVR